MRHISMLRFALIAALTFSAFGTLGGRAASAAWGADYFPNLPVVTHEGKTVKFFDDLIEGKLVVINFIYASCTQVCPLTTARMVQVQKALGDRVGRDIFMVSITLDPENDTPEVLKELAEAYNVGPGWTFLTGDPEDIGLIRYKLGERSRYLAEHRNDFVVGNAATGEWMRYSMFSDLDRIVTTILEMDPVWRATVHAEPEKSFANYTGAGIRLPGQGLFRKTCASCHTIGKGDLVGPDLKDVTLRRDPDWLARYMMMPHKMLADGDPIAVELDSRYKAAKMPYLGLSEVDVKDLVSYLKAHSERLDAEAEAAETTQVQVLDSTPKNTSTE